VALRGVYLPIITPFRGGEVDYVSYRRLLEHYLSKGISGFIPCATTGEAPTVDEDEVLRIVDATAQTVGDRVPVYVGCSGNDTAKLVKHAKRLEARGVKGILSACPYYNRPDQRGIYEHYLKIAESTSLKIVVYNIPYRTGRNIENETLRRLAAIPAVVGLKDSCGDLKQSSELLLDPPKDFSILTGDATERFLEVYRLVGQNDHRAALGVWKTLAALVPLLFVEPNPAPIKYLLHKTGLISSAETRLPLVGITDALARKLDAAMTEL
jgi:4-hydroxy-tetrahydrodipicolinate synthase